VTLLIEGIRSDLKLYLATLVDVCRSFFYDYVSSLDQLQLVSRLESWQPIIWACWTPERISKVTFSTSWDRSSCIDRIYQLFFAYGWFLSKLILKILLILSSAATVSTCFRFIVTFLHYFFNLEILTLQQFIFIDFLLFIWVKTNWKLLLEWLLFFFWLGFWIYLGIVVGWTFIHFQWF